MNYDFARFFGFLALTIATPGCGDDSGDSAAEGTTGANGSGEIGNDGGNDAGGGNDDAGNSGLEGLGCTAPTSCDRGEFVGRVRIETAADVETYAGYTSFDGDLEINESAVVCLDFLACLETSRRDVSIFGNTELIDLSGLNNLTEVGADDVPSTVPGEPPSDKGTIVISDNPALVDMNGFTNLREIKLSLNINRNESLETVSGFADLAVIQQDLTIRDNPLLTSLEGLYDLQALGGALNVTQNPSMCVGETCKIACDLQQWSGQGSTEANRDCGGASCAGGFCE